MPKSHLAQDLVKVDEFFVLVPESQKADLIDGAIYMASPETRRHNKIRFLIQGYAETKGLGEVFGSRYLMSLSSQTNDFIWLKSPK
jgi:hypothetical protein